MTDKEWKEFEKSLPTIEQLRNEFIESLDNNLAGLVADKIFEVGCDIDKLRMIANGELLIDTTTNGPIYQIALALQLQAWATFAGVYYAVTRPVQQQTVKDE